MSHFTVMVIGLDYEKQLAPYHEYECTGHDDEYVVDVDITDQLIADHNKHSKGRTLAEFAESWNGAVERNNRWYIHTNPNAKWDWYVLGGRWTGFLKLKPMKRGILGRPGLMTEDPPPGHADRAMKGDVDFEQMRNDAEVKARALWKLCREVTGGRTWETWEEVLARFKGDVDAGRNFYHAQPALVAIREANNDVLRWDEDDLTLDEDKFIQLRRDQAAACSAFVRDGIWTEGGKMGWWGMVSEPVSEERWLSRFNAMLDALPDDTLLTVVDCHI